MADSNGVRIFILSVTRDLGDSLSAELADAVTAAGHTLVGRDMVHPDADAARSALARRLADPKVQAVIVAGAAQRWGSDAGSRAVAGKLARPLLGLAELYRGLALELRGPEVLLDEVLGGLSEEKKAVFALPDHEEAALLVAKRLILPLLQTLLSRADGALRAEAASLPAPAGSGASPASAAQRAPEPRADAEEEEAAAPVPDGVSVTQIHAARPNEDKELLSSGWESGQRALGGELRRSWPEIPEAFERLSASLDVLNSATQRAELLLADGKKLGAFAYPDFSRVESRILLIAAGDEWPEVIALHRHPRPVGTVVPGGSLKLPDQEPEALSERMFGRPSPNGGDLFAVEGDALYLLRQRRVYRWDGRREQEQGTVSQTLASLMLRWTQR